MATTQGFCCAFNPSPPALRSDLRLSRFLFENGLLGDPEFAGADKELDLIPLAGRIMGLEVRISNIRYTILYEEEETGSFIDSNTKKS